MSEQEKPKPKSQTKEYYTNYAREKRAKTKKCVICKGQAWGKILLTQEYRCPIHMVEPLKQEIIKQQKTNNHEKPD
jgi:hypothetical protein